MTGTFPRAFLDRRSRVPHHAGPMKAGKMRELKMAAVVGRMLRVGLPEALERLPIPRTMSSARRTRTVRTILLP